MTLVVPFDGSDLSEAALVRATQFGDVFEEPVLAVSVVPDDADDYARERGWIAADEEFDRGTVVSRLREQVRRCAPSADFRHVVVDRFARAGTVSSRVRKVARDVDASMVFIGSENAGRLVTAVSSVGASVAADDAYDVVIVRHAGPTRISRLYDATPQGASESDGRDSE